MTASNDILLLPLEGDLDVTSVAGVRAIIDEHMSEGCKRIIVNMADTDYIDSMGVALLFTTARRLHEQGGLLSLVNVSDPVYRTLTICRLVDFIPVANTAPKPPIPALSPTAHPLWQGKMHVNPTRLSDVRRRLSEVLERTDLTPEEVFDLTLAAGEALGNAIDHTEAEGVLCSLEIYGDRAILEVTDCGGGFDPECANKTPEEQNLERGRGIKLMNLLADSVEIQDKSNGSGTVVRLVKLYTPFEMRR